MKANIIYFLGVLAVIAFAIYSLFHYEWEEAQQGLYLLPFGVVIGVLVYLSTRERRGK